MRIRQTQVRAFIKDTIMNIRLGQRDLQDVGITFQDGLPKEVAFSLDVVQTPQDLTTVTTQTGGEAAATDTTVEGAATNVETTVRTAEQDVGEGGSDTQTTTNTWESFEE